jgi:hypothetical protein
VHLAEELSFREKLCCTHTSLQMIDGVLPIDFACLLVVVYEYFT